MRPFEKLKVWICVPPDNECIAYEIPMKSIRPTPVDFLGYKTTCCRCFKLKPASILICLISFAWAAYELGSIEKQMNKMFVTSPHSSLRKPTKVFYTLSVVLFVFSTGMLLLGLLANKEVLLHLYIWLAFIFNCIALIFSTIRVVAILMSDEVIKKGSAGIVIAVSWFCLFTYLLVVVNSYRIRL